MKAGDSVFVHFMRTFFWLDEDSPGSICLFQLVRNPGKSGACDDTSVRYNGSIRSPAGIYFRYYLVDESGFYVSRNLMLGRSPETNTLNGNLTGLLLVTIVKSVNRVFHEQK